MFGLAIRLDISEQYLRNINGISGSLYPGMVLLFIIQTIKLPKDTDLKKL
jgi:phage shock protein PspC (stress-responsive transcriptional regulator)